MYRLAVEMPKEAADRLRCEHYVLESCCQILQHFILDVTACLWFTPERIELDNAAAKCLYLPNNWIG